MHDSAYKKWLKRLEKIKINILLCEADDIYKILRNVIADRYMLID